MSYPNAAQLMGMVERLIAVCKYRSKIMLTDAGLQRGEGRGLMLAGMRHASMLYAFVPKESLQWKSPKDILSFPTDHKLILNLPFGSLGVFWHVLAI